MSTKLHVEIKEIASASFDAIRELFEVIRLERVEKDSVKSNNPRILIDKDGNPTLNFQNTEVLAEFQTNLDKLSKWQPSQDQR